jgi:hypothetical protein
MPRNNKLFIEILPGYYVRVNKTVQKLAGKRIKKWQPKVKSPTRKEALNSLSKLLARPK